MYTVLVWRLSRYGEEGTNKKALSTYVAECKSEKVKIADISLIILAAYLLNLLLLWRFCVIY